MRAALFVGNGKMATHRDFPSNNNIPLGKCAEGNEPLYDSFDQAWNASTYTYTDGSRDGITCSVRRRVCSKAQDVILGYLGLVRGAHRIQGRYDRTVDELMKEAADKGLFSVNVLIGSPSTAPGMSWSPAMFRSGRRGTGDYEMPGDNNMRLIHESGLPLSLNRLGAEVVAERVEVEFDLDGERCLVTAGRSGSEIYEGYFISLGRQEWHSGDTMDGLLLAEVQLGPEESGKLGALLLYGDYKGPHTSRGEERRRLFRRKGTLNLQTSFEMTLKHTRTYTLC